MSESVTMLSTNGYEFLVDSEDVAAVSKYSWFVFARPEDKAYLRVRGITGDAKNVYLHRFLTNAPKDKVVDHINGNALDNRRSNLRVVDQAQNLMNRRKPLTQTKANYKGVHPGYKEVWVAHIRVNNKRIHLGTFNTEIEAAIAYDMASEKYHGEFGKKNFPDGPPVVIDVTPRREGKSGPKRNLKLAERLAA